MRILLVDDEKEFVATLAERLSLRDIEADWVTSAKEAEKIVETRHYDLVVLDVKMPQMGGLKLKQILEKKLPGIKTIYLTGHGSEEDFRAGSAQAEYYLMKPVNISELIEKIKSALAE